MAEALRFRADLSLSGIAEAVRQHTSEIHKHLQTGLRAGVGKGGFASSRDARACWGWAWASGGALAAHGHGGVSFENSHPSFRYHVWPHFIFIEGLAFFWVSEDSMGVWERSMESSP